MLKIFKYLNFTDEDVAKFDSETMQMAAMIEGFQSVYSTTLDTNPKKPLLAATIAESIRILLKRIYSIEGLDKRVEQSIKEEMSKLPNAEELPQKKQQQQQQKQKQMPQQPMPKQQKPKEEPKSQPQQQQPQQEPPKDIKIKVGDKFYHFLDPNQIDKIERIENGNVIVSWYDENNSYHEVDMGFSLDTMQKKFNEGTYILIEEEPKKEPKPQLPQPQPQQQEPPKEKKLLFKVGDVFENTATISSLSLSIEDIDFSNNIVTTVYENGRNIIYKIDDVNLYIRTGLFVKIEKPKTQLPQPKQQEPPQPKPEPKQKRGRKKKEPIVEEEIEFTETELQEAIDGLELLEDMSEDIQQELAKLREKIKNIQSKL